MDPAESQALRAWLALHQCAAAALGHRNWRRLCSQGRVMAGAHCGQYVSGLPAAQVHALIDALLRGEEIPVHLMHRHRSGHPESSRLRWVDGQLFMVFGDRIEVA